MSIEVVIPAHNAAPFLRAGLASVAAQTLPPSLVSIVDDASTDDTLAVAEQAGRELADRLRIRIMRNEGPRGPAAARNTAIRRSDAELIAPLDADDLMLPDHLATLAAALDAAPDAVLAFGDTDVFSASDTAETVRIPSILRHSGIAGLPAIEFQPGCWALRDGMFGRLLHSGVFATSACLFRRQAAIDAGLFDEAMVYGEDTDLFLRLALAGRFVFSRRHLSRKREHAANMTQERNRLEFCHGIVWSLVKLLRDTEGLSAEYRTQARQALARAVQTYLYHASRAGPAAYRRATATARQAGHGGMALHPRHLLRLAAHSLR